MIKSTITYFKDGTARMVISDYDSHIEETTMQPIIPSNQIPIRKKQKAIQRKKRNIKDLISNIETYEHLYFFTFTSQVEDYNKLHNDFKNLVRKHPYLRFLWVYDTGIHSSLYHIHAIICSTQYMSWKNFPEWKNYIHCSLIRSTNATSFYLAKKGLRLHRTKNWTKPDRATYYFSSLKAMELFIHRTFIITNWNYLINPTRTIFYLEPIN